MHPYDNAQTRLRHGHGANWVHILTIFRRRVAKCRNVEMGAESDRLHAFQQDFDIGGFPDVGKGMKLERIMAVQLPHGSSVALSWDLPNLSNKERNCARCCPVFASVIYLLSVENC